MINSGGENIYPDEIEDALVRCPAIDEVIVAGLPHDKWGQAVTAFVIPRAGVSAQRALADLTEYIRTQSGLSSLARPKRVVVVDRIPKSAVGKVLRREFVSGNFSALAETADGPITATTQRISE